MYEHTFFRRVTYADTDQMGYLYYGHYAEYYEVGRVEMLRSLGLSYREMEEQHGILMPVVYLQSRYVRPALYDQNLRIVTRLEKLPDSSITFHTQLFNENDELINGGLVKLCFIRKDNGERISVPKFLLEKLLPYFDANEAI